MRPLSGLSSICCTAQSPHLPLGPNPPASPAKVSKSTEATPPSASQKRLQGAPASIVPQGEPHEARPSSSSALQERLEGAAAVGRLHGVVAADVRPLHEHVRYRGLQRDGDR